MAKIRKSLEKIDLRKNPYRGVVRELAEEEGVTRGAITKAVRVYRNPRIIALLLEKIRKREEVMRQAEEKGVV